MAKKLIKIFFKITPNLEGLASRLAFIDYYVFNKEFEGDAEENLDYREFIIGIGEKLGDVYGWLLKKGNADKVRNYIRRSRWEDFYVRQLNKIEEVITLPDDLQIFVRTLPENYQKMNCLSLKIALWEFLELVKRNLFEIEIDDYIPKILEKVEEYKRMLQAITVQSFHKLTKIDVWDAVIEEKLKRLTDLGRRFLSFIIFAFRKGYGVIDKETILSNSELEDRFTKLFSQGYKYLSNVIKKLTDENRTILESFGIKIWPNYITIEDEFKLKRIEEIYGGDEYE